MACNTAHLLLPELQQRIGHRFTSLVENAVNEVLSRKMSRIGLIASPTTIHTQLYQAALEARGIEVLVPTAQECSAVEAVIRGVIAGNNHARLRAMLVPISQSLRAQGAEAVLLGCTELSVLYPREQPHRVDPLHIIVKPLIGE